MTPVRLIHPSPTATRRAEGTVVPASQEKGRVPTRTIEVGKEADLVVTSQNPFDVEPTAVHRTKVEMTFIAGERVYTAGAN